VSFSADAIPRLRPGAEVTRLGGEFVVLDGSGRMLRGLNATAARIWELVDGRRPADEIARIIACEYGTPEEVVLRDVLGFLGVLAGKGLIERSPPAGGEAGGVR
jgi:pyrroloquinoline quinone biosynthesis protein D